MANVIKTVITYPLNGSTRDFNIPFEYLARKFIQVTLIGRDRKPLTNIDDYRFTSKNQITTNKAWGTGDGYQLIELRRFTSATERLVDFSDGSILRAYDLNVSQIQTLHVAEEARDLTADTIGVNNDGDLDARGRRIVNLADPVNEMDAVNLKTIKEWNNGAYQSYLKAKEEAEKSARSATASKTSETNAFNHMTKAGTSEQRSKASETSAENSKNAAAASAQSATQSASSASNSAKEATGAKDYTKQQADRSYTEAERAKGYADSMGNAINIGKVINDINPETGYTSWKGEHQFVNRVGVSDGLPGSFTSRIYMTAEFGKPQLGALEGTWRLFDMPLENKGRIATREWTQNNRTLNSTLDMQRGNGSASHIAFRNWGDGDRKTVFEVGDSTSYFFYAQRTGSGTVDFSVNGRILANGQIIATQPWVNNQGFATQSWSNSQYVRKSPTWRKIWTGKFAKGDTITLSESIIGKVIAVKAYDRNRWETIHILWAGSWATGAGGSVNMFTVASNGRTLTSNYENEGGYWTEIWVVE